MTQETTTDTKNTAAIKKPDAIRLRRAHFIRMIPEWILALTVLVSLVWVIDWYILYNFMPQPLHEVPSDTWMDWFNPAYWGDRPVRYSEWKAIYLPLSFMFLDLVTLENCYHSDSFFARDCDTVSYFVIISVYILCACAAAYNFFLNDRHNYVPRSIAFVFGLPMIFLLERANLLICAFPLFVYVFGVTKKNPIVQAIANGLMVNFKPYLVIPVLMYAVKRRWRLAEMAAIATILVYFISYAYVGDGAPWQIYENYTKYWTEEYISNIFHSTSYTPFLYLVRSNYPMTELLGSPIIDGVDLLVPLVTGLSMAAMVLALAAAWLQPGAVTGQRIAAILMVGYMVTTALPTYGFIILIFLVFLEKWERFWPIVAIVSCYLLSIYADYPLTLLWESHDMNWSNGRYAFVPVSITLGHFVRPGLCILVLWALSIDTILESLKAHRHTRPCVGLTLPSDISGPGSGRALAPSSGPNPGSGNSRPAT